MKITTVKALKAYLLLPAQDKMQFLTALRNIEKMPVIVRQDYIKTLLSFGSGDSSAKDGLQGNPAGT